jgi:DNA-binding GntR family transcriptional regulator
VGKSRPNNGNGRTGATQDKRGGGYVLERAYDALLGAIRQNKFQPGQRLLETQICLWLHMSRTPVREAMRRLEAQGLLEHSPGGGITVCLHDFHAVAELYVFRETLEGAAADLAAKHADKTEIDLLAALVQIQRDLPEDAEIHARENKVFHDHLYRAAHNQFLLKSLQSLNESVALLGRTTLTVPGRIEVAIREHGEIVSAIASRDQQRAHDLARQHVRSSYEARVRLIMEALDHAARMPAEIETPRDIDSRRDH